MKDTRHLTPAAKGAWIDIMVAMWNAQTRGVLTLPMVGYARLIGATADQAVALIDELTDPSSQVCDRENLPDGRIKLTCRRIVRDEEDRAKIRDRVAKHRRNANKAAIQPDGNAVVTPLKQPSSSSSSSSSSISTSGGTPIEPPRLNCPSLKQALDYFSKLSDYTPEEIKSVWHRFECTKSTETGIWFFGKSPVGDWRSAMETCLSERRINRNARNESLGRQGSDRNKGTANEQRVNDYKGVTNH